MRMWILFQMHSGNCSCGSLSSAVLLLTACVVSPERFTYRKSEVCILGHPYIYTYPQIRRTCCNDARRRYYGTWNMMEVALMQYFEKLESWKCDIIKEECSRRPYAITPYSDMVYMRFCNVTEFRRGCLSSILQLAPRKYVSPLINDSIPDEEWLNILKPVKEIATTDNIYQKPCLQIALHDVMESGRYHEIINIQMPFCALTWCGMTADISGFDEISDWTCLSRG